MEQNVISKNSQLNNQSQAKNQSQKQFENQIQDKEQLQVNKQNSKNKQNNETDIQKKLEHEISPSSRQKRNEKYKAYVEAKSPKTKNFPSLINSFWVGGLICCLGQGISDGLAYFFPQMTETELGSWMLIVLIFLTCFLTAIGVFDKIGNFAGAGTIIPITGFANSIASPALEYKKEGIIFGVCSKMFIVAGPVIVCGTVASVIVGIVYLFI